MPTTDLEKVIEESRWLYDLKEDWDEEGAKPIIRETWDRAVEIVRKSQRDEYPIPQLSPGPGDGSIDVRWNWTSFLLTHKWKELLLNVPQWLCDPCNFYGGSDEGGKVEGRTDKTDISRHLTWIDECNES